MEMLDKIIYNFFAGIDKIFETLGSLLERRKNAKSNTRRPKSKI
jgi:hypothetical protein